MTVTLTQDGSTMATTITPANSHLQFRNLANNHPAIPTYGFYATGGSLLYDYSFGNEADFIPNVPGPFAIVQFIPVLTFFGPGSPGNVGSYIGVTVDPSGFQTALG